ncbi:MAG: class I SAM-dependent methyltransferase [Arenimonas sp.]|jgi:SAM-dependent methyltransferase
MAAASPSRPLRLACAVALISCAALGYQLLLMRWLAIAHWHPFAVVIISLALLGHGASGTALSLLRERAVRHFEWIFPACALAFAATAALCVLLAGAIPFNGLELVWDLRQLGWLGALYLCLSLPFFFAAACFGLAFARHGPDIPMLYGADLLGAGAGAALALVLSWLAPVDTGLGVVAAIAASAAALGAGGPARWAIRICAALMLPALILATSARVLAPPVNEFKGLAKSLLVRDARIIAERHSSYGWLAVVESPRIPLRQVPGLSLANEQEPPAQLAVYTDGDALTVLTRRVDAAHSAYLGRTTSALPYRLLARPRVLVLGAGGGFDILQALSLGAREVRAVETNPQMIGLVRDTYASYAGQLYGDPRVRLQVADIRGFARANGEQYDLIVLAHGGSATAGSAGVQAVAEDYAVTVQALRDYHRRLAPGGFLAITRWQKQPPRDALKLFATATVALRAEGVRDPARQLVVIRSWDAGTVLLKRGEFDAREIALLRSFADEWGFDPVHFPGMRSDEANRYNVLARDDERAGALALLSPRPQSYLDAYKFDIRPATDDRPYFGNFFKWATLPELWRLRTQGAAVLLDSGYLLLLAALAQALPLAIILVLLPLLALPRASSSETVSRWRAAIYFICLGLAFLFIEIACLSRLTLLIGQPLLAFGAGLSGFLLFAGAGSVFAQHWLAQDKHPIPSLIVRAVLAIAAGIAWQLLAFPVALEMGAGWLPAWRALLGVLTIAPVAFAMGLPFPLGLTRLARSAPAFVPWAWGLNGCASVLAAIAALLLGIGIGLTATLLVALGLYLLAAAVWGGAEKAL